MRQKINRIVAGVLAFILMFTIIPAQNAQAAPAKLSIKDFYYTSSGYETTFMEKDDDYSGTLAVYTYKEMKTHRGIKVGSKLSAVKSKYGNAAKKKFNTKDSLNKYIKEYYFAYGIDFSKWKSYVEYAYKKNTKNDRRLRFYLDKKDKVTAIVYIYKYKTYKLTKKKVKSIGLSFQAPKGKKITTKTINGKKVQILPAGTKLKYKQSKVPEFGILGYVNLYDSKNGLCGYTSIPINFTWSFMNGQDIETFLDQSSFLTIKPSNGQLVKPNLKKLGKYNYFELIIYDNNQKGGYDLPLRYYFRLE